MRDGDLGASRRSPCRHAIGLIYSYRPGSEDVHITCSTSSGGTCGTVSAASIPWRDGCSKRELWVALTPRLSTNATCQLEKTERRAAGTALRGQKRGSGLVPQRSPLKLESGCGRPEVAKCCG